MRLDWCFVARTMLEGRRLLVFGFMCPGRTSRGPCDQKPVSRHQFLDTILNEYSVIKRYGINDKFLQLAQLHAFHVIHNRPPERSLARRMLINLYDACEVMCVYTWESVPEDISQELSQLNTSRQGVKNPDLRPYHEGIYHKLVSDRVSA